MNADDDVERNSKVKVVVKNIKSKMEHIEKLNEMIVDTIEEEKIAEEMENAAELELLIDTEVTLMEEKLNELSIIEKVDEVSNKDNFTKKGISDLDDSPEKEEAAVERRNYRVKLPPLTVKNFNGDPIVWPQFIDTFYNAVHENKSLTAIEKFIYMKSYLEGDAARCVEGLSLTSENYEHCLKILEKRFGNKQLVRTKHMGICQVRVPCQRSSCLVR